MHPVQRALHVRQAGRGKCSDKRRIWLHSKADAVDRTVRSDPWSGKHINIRMHPRVDAVKLGLAEVRDGPPDTRIDQSEDLLASVGVSALRDIQVRHTCVERRVDPAIIEIVFGSSDRRSAALTLSGQRVDGEHTVLRLAELRMALLDYGLGLLILRLGRLHLSFREYYQRTLLTYSHLLRSDRGL